MQLAIILAGLLADYLKSTKNKDAQNVGSEIEFADKVTLAILQENARIKGAVVDWNDPVAVQAFLVTLPAPTKIE